ncbi:polyketide synthase [Streptomyces sp. NPDC053048]|uniref:polyketide synthase n=1 Tax=Streptomyces sp. NPDC053048 TaxID=3365694 RepID=UPI0037D92B32
MTGPHTRGPGGGQPIAVIGMGCAYPGARGPEEFWELITNGHDAVGDVPPARSGTSASGTSASGAGEHRTTAHRGGFLDAGHPALDAGAFDAAAFGVTPGEAAVMDPQQRLLLTTAREALEDAGIPAGRLAGSRTAVFVGQSHSDHWDNLRAGDRDGLGLDAFSGAHQRGLLAGRLAHAFDLRGEAVTVDTAQASSLTALHLACRALRSGDATTALAGG